MRLITRGLGGGQASGMILQGMTLDVIRIVRAGRTIAKDIYQNLIEEFTIAAKLMVINGKELSYPIFNKRKYLIDESVKAKVFIRKMNIKSKKSKNVSVIADLLKIKRG